MIRTIPLKIQNEYITGDKGMIGAAGSHNDVILRMEFSGMWDGLTKMVQFRDALGEATIEVLLTADMLEADDTSVYLVPVPNGAKKYAGEMTLCIKGAAVSAQKETRATLAVYGRFTVAESKWSADAETEADVPASNVEKLQGQINNVLATIVDARKAATEAAKSAESAALSQSRAQTSEQYAGEYAQDAADSAIAAGNSAASASDSATAAASSATAAKASEDAAAGFTTNAARYSEDAALSQSRALASERYAGEYAQDAANSATAAATSAQTAQSAASTASTAAEAASGSASKAQESAAAADNSEKKATAAATKAEASSNHPPRINSNGKWELWDATKSAYVATEYTAIGKDGTKWWTYAYPIGITDALEVFMGKANLPDAAIGDYVLHTMSDAGIVFEITGETASGNSWVVKEKCTLRGKDGTTPHIGANGNWYIGDTDTGVSAGGASYIFKVTVVTGPDPDSLSADKTFAEIKSAYSSGSMVVVQQGSTLYELTYMSNTRAEFTRVNATYYDVLSCSNSGAPQETDGWQLNRTKRLNYDTKYRDIGLKTVPVAIKELQDKSVPAVTDADTGKYLHVNVSTKELEWAEVKSGGGSDLPAVTAADAGKFLRVSSSGSWVAETVANANGGEF